MNDFVNTTTSEKYIAGNWTNFNATDVVQNIGRFRAQLSASAGFNWSIASAAVINFPIFEIDWLSWTPAYSASGSLTYTSVSTIFAKYKLVGHAKSEFEIQASGTLGGSASTDLYTTMPFESAQSANSPTCGAGNTATVAAKVFVTAGTPDKLSFQKYDGSNYATSGSCVIKGIGMYET
jgi:hypothetical protein